jgi:DNA-binding transcriptional LysR family regulator
MLMKSISLFVMLDLRRLHTFREVMARRSFSAAAEALDYTQSSVSQQVAALEREVGVTLVDRTCRPISATPAGELVLARADALLGQAQLVADELAELREGAAGTLRMGGFFTAWATFLPGAVAAFARARPAVQLELRQTEPDPAARAVRAAELDLAVVYRYPDEPEDADLDVTPLLDDRYAVALPSRHPLARGDTVKLADLADEAWVLPPAGHAYTQLVRRLCADAAGFEPRVTLETGDIAMVQPLVAAGLAVSLLPALGLAPRHRDIVVRPLAGAPLARQVQVLRLARHRSPVAVAMTDQLRTAASRHRASE